MRKSGNKKRGMLLGAAAVLLLLLYFVGSGFLKATSVCIGEYSVSEDGGAITVRIFSSSSAGYVRSVSVSSGEDGTMRLDFYAAFGGINGNIGAKAGFVLPLGEDTARIAVNRGAGRYETVLIKDAEGNWVRAEQ